MIMKSNKQNLISLVKKGLIVILTVALIDIICISIGVYNKYIMVISMEAIPISMIIFLIQYIKRSKSEPHDLQEKRYSIWTNNIDFSQAMLKMMIILLILMSLAILSMLFTGNTEFHRTA